MDESNSAAKRIDSQRPVSSAVAGAGPIGLTSRRSVLRASGATDAGSGAMPLRRVLPG